jgi:hypothetical protein
MHAATSKVENSAQGYSCKLKFVHGVCVHALCLQGCAHCLHWSERERERKRGMESEREREGEKEREREREREICGICPELFFFILKGMTGS